MSGERTGPPRDPRASRLAPRAPSWAEGAVGERVPCAQHPSVETYLRCRMCGRPICPRCAVATPEGARCTRCAAARGRRQRAGTLGMGRLGRTVAGGLAGLAVAMAGGAALTFVPFGALRMLPLVVLGYLVGEVSAAVARRPGGIGLALLAFGSALVGPLASEAALANLLVAGQSAASTSLSGSAASLGPFGALALVAGAVLAAARGGTGEP